MTSLSNGNTFGTLPGSELDVSVVIGFRDWGLRRIRLAVESIQNSFGDKTGEVIISDYGSENPGENEELARELGCGYAFTPYVEKWSRSRALNAGFAEARGSLLVSTDADMIFSPKSFERICELAERDSQSAFFLQCRDLPELMDDEWVEAHPNAWEELERNSRLRPRWGMGGMMAISREGFAEIRGFDERLHTYGGEDLDFAQRARRAGYKTVWINDDNVRMYHMWHPPTQREVDKTEEGRQAVEFNRNIVYNDKSFVRNFLNWEYRQHSAAPLITVAICTHNRADLLKEALNSVLVQTMQDFEVVIVDDGGEDHTREIVDSFGDPRFRYVWQEQAGISAARNHAARISRGIYTAVLDDDDLMHPRRLEWHLANLVPGSAGNCGAFVNFDNESGELELIVSKVPSLEVAMEKGAAPGHSTWMVRTDAIRHLGYDESLSSGVDNNMMLRLLRSGLKMTHTGKPVTLRRMHSGQVTVTDGAQQAASAVSALDFLRWRLNPGDVKNMKKAAEAAGEYPKIEGRDELIEEVRPYLPDHLVNRNLRIVSIKPLSDQGWDGDPHRSEIVIDGMENSSVHIMYVIGATYTDMVRARSEELVFTAELEDEESPASYDLDRVARTAASAAAMSGVDNYALIAAPKSPDQGSDRADWELVLVDSNDIEPSILQPGWIVLADQYLEASNSED